MAEKDVETGVIEHLLQVEKDASSLIDEAVREADSRIAAAKSRYNSEYKSRYDDMVGKLDRDYNAEIQELKDSHKKLLENYEAEMRSSPRHQEEFNKLLDKLLFEAV